MDTREEKKPAAALQMTALGLIAWPDVPFALQARLSLVMRVGSESHGTRIPSEDPDSIDDRDIMGVVIPPINYYLGLKKWEGADSIKGEWDVTLYEYRKFVSLLLKQNPNVLGCLWLEDEDYLKVGDTAAWLIENREIFQARTQAYNSFVGYSRSQLKKMESGAFKGYMGEKRKQLVERFGYDTKNAAHLIRLLLMGGEYLRNRTMTVRRVDDADMIMDIKRGGWTLDRVKSYASELFRACDEAHRDSSMPYMISDENMELIEQHLVSALR